MAEPVAMANLFIYSLIFGTDGGERIELETSEVEEWALATKFSPSGKWLGSCNQESISNYNNGVMN